MSELDPEDLALFEAARGADLPTAADRARIQRRLAAKLGAAAVGLTAATTTATAAGAGAGASASAGVWLTSATVTKIVVGIALVGGIGAGSVVTYRSRQAPTVAAAVVPTGPASAASPPRAPLPMPSFSAEPESATAPSATAVADDPTPPPRVEIAQPSTRPHASSVPAAPPPPRSTLDDEMRLLADADAELRSGNGSRALSLLDEHARRFPRSGLDEERQVERILALCAAGRTAEARAASDAFFRAHRASPYSARLRGSCAFP